MKPLTRHAGLRLPGLMAGLGLAAGILAGCSSDTPVPLPADMASGKAMQPDQNRPGAWIYRAPDANLKRYTRFIVDPVQVYRGADASFGGLNSAQVNEIAQLLTSEARRALGSGYPVTTQPGPDTARITMKLVGVEETVTGVATASRILPIGTIANIVQGSSGEGGTFTGGVILAAEVHDSQTSKLLGAAVRRSNPAAFDLEATLSTMDTARAAAREAARELRAAIDRVQGRTNR